MSGEINIESLPINTMTYKAQKQLSLLLNSKKVLCTDCPEKLQRDWRGLATLLRIPSEETSNLDNDPEKIFKILGFWQQRKDNTATIGTLLLFLQKLDRFDVYDDLLELHKLGQLVEVPINKNNVSKPNINPQDVTEDCLTYDDVKFRTPQYYHAYVLYAKEDRDFAEELLNRMRSQGHKMCTEEDLLPGHSTQYEPVAKLISQRCHRIVLIYSPDFLQSSANYFYMNYAQALGIESKKPKIIPCMYRPCTLPEHVSFYHKLYYSAPSGNSLYDFWDKLSQSLAVANLPRIKNASKSLQPAKISRGSLLSDSMDSTKLVPALPNRNLLALPEPTNAKSSSLIDLPTLEVQLPSEDLGSLGNLSETSVERRRKKFDAFRKIFGHLKGKKQKQKVILVET